MAKHRLFEITYYLLKHGQATAPELAREHEVSVRTIYRDLDTLSTLGIPVYTEQGQGGGIRLRKEFVLDRSLIDDQEKEFLLLALSQLSATGMKEAKEALTKLGGLFQKQAVDWIEVDFSTWTRTQMDENLFGMLQQAVLRKQVIEFSYYGRKEASARRKVEPWKLVYKSMSWYVYGFCQTRQEPRFFKLNRIRELRLLDEKVTTPVMEEPEASMEPAIHRVKVKLRFQKELAYRVYDDFAESVTEDEQGNLIVKAELPEDPMTLRYFLTFGDGLEVLEPLDLRQKMREMVLNLKKIYET